MGKRGRKRRRASKTAPPPAPAEGVRESPLLEKQTHPEMRRTIQTLAEVLRARYGEEP